MKNLTVNYLFILLMVGFLHLVSPTVNAQDMAQAKALCTNLTPSNRAMAERAGYNVDDLCSGQKTQSKGLKAVKPRTIVNRNTASSAATSVKNTEASAPRLQNSKLTPFGYDLFANAPTTFAPSESLSVSADYLLGPGDSLDILFYGKLNRNFSVEINREGFVDFPELGPVALAGLSYGEAKSM
ncbi:MAG: polysaccharide biosynthesis/export family protein, partial [Porticoccaceae bacterium]|nr:polysaccharide biosynthesis/export family protein [Porticoccaceae bacterium]